MYVISQGKGRKYRKINVLNLKGSQVAIECLG